MATNEITITTQGKWIFLYVVMSMMFCRYIACEKRVLMFYIEVLHIAVHWKICYYFLVKWMYQILLVAKFQEWTKFYNQIYILNAQCNIIRNQLMDDWVWIAHERTVLNMSTFHDNEYIFINFTIRENHFFCERYRNKTTLYNKVKPLRTSPTLYLSIRIHFVYCQLWEFHPWSRICRPVDDFRYPRHLRDRWCLNIVRRK